MILGYAVISPSASVEARKTTAAKHQTAQPEICLDPDARTIWRIKRYTNFWRKSMAIWWRRRASAGAGTAGTSCTAAITLASPEALSPNESPAKPLDCTIDLSCLFRMFFRTTLALSPTASPVQSRPAN
jgi:hypothetical protein